MANSVIGALRVMLGMDTSEFEKGATSAQRSAARFEKDMLKLGGNLQKVGLGMTAALTAPLLAVGAAGTAAANQLAEDTERMRLAAKNAGTGFEEFQRGAYAALVGAGIESEKFADILKDTQDKIGDFAATGGGELKDFFEKVAAPQGLKVQDFIGKGSIEQLQMFVAALEKAKVPQEQMVFYLESIADEGSKLVPILTQNGALLDQLGGKAAVVDPAAAAQLKEYTTAQQEMNNALRELTIALVKSGLIEAMTSLVKTVASTVGEFAKANPELFKFVAVAGGILAAIGPVLTGIGSLITIAPKLASAFGMIRVAATALMAHPIILGFAAVIYGIYLAWQNWDTIVDIVSRLYTGVKAWLVDKLGAVFNWLRDKIKAVTGFFFDMYDAVVGNSYVPDMVEEIGIEFARLQSLMVDPAEKAAQGTKDAMRDMASEVSGLLDRLFPKFAEARRMAEDLALLDQAAGKGLISGDLRQSARLRVLGYGKGKAAVSDGLLSEGPLAEVDKVREATKRISEEMAGLGDRTEVQTVRIAKTFQDMVTESLGALRKLADGIKGGSFFDILDGIIGLGTTLGQAGVFGKNFQSFLSQTPGFATGGAMRLGGLAGIDRNVLSLNGSPIARVTAGETMQIRPANDRGTGQTVVQNFYTLPSDEFWSRVDGRAAGVAAPIAQATTARAFQRAQAAQTRSLA